MANIYLKRELYDEIIRLNLDPKIVVNDLVDGYLKQLKTIEVLNEVK